MGLLDKAKAAAEQATAKAKEGVQDVQTKWELSQAYQELGKTAYLLAESGELSHGSLTSQIDRIRTLKADLEEQREPAMAGAATSSEQQTSPPADEPS